MATNNMASDAFKRAQNLLSPGYNKIDTFEAVTTLSKDDAQDLARAMKLDAGVTGYGNTPFNDNQASMDSYFPSINEPAIPEEAVTTPVQEDPDEITYKNTRREDFNNGVDTVAKGVDWLGNKYNEILNNTKSLGIKNENGEDSTWQSGMSFASDLPEFDDDDSSKATAGMPPDAQKDFITYMDFLKEEEDFRATPYRLGEEKQNTIGYGHYGTDVQEGLNITKRQANNILRNDIETRLPKIRKAIPQFEDLPIDARKHLLGSWFRGSLSGSPKTLALIKARKYKEAAKEFLDNDEYKTTKFGGVKKRMRATAQALRNLK